MAAQVTEKKLNLKILVDVKAQKVVFAEVGKDFVDFIFHIMSLPLSSITKVLNEKSGMVGCLGTLYKSIRSLGSQYYEPNLNKDSVLNPSVPVVVPLLSLNDFSTTVKLYKCTSHPGYVSRQPGNMCPNCRYETIVSEFSYTYISSTTAPGYVKGAVSYMVMDNLDVKPMSITLIRSLVKDFDYLEEKEVEFGLQEGLTLLKASLEKQDVLTTVLI